MDVEKIKKRVMDLLKSPETEWKVIADEGGDIASLYMNYIIPLAAIPAVSMMLGLLVIGAPIAGRIGIAGAVSAAIGSFVAAIVGPIIGAVIIEQLAPKFGSSGNTVQALKLVAYASTPMWVSGVVYLFILLAPLMIVAALYAIYLFYVGLPVMMKTPHDQVVPYMVVSAIAIIVVSIVIRVLEGVVGLPIYGF
jgi:hypothetical protein